jgi:hypothetical protein
MGRAEPDAGGSALKPELLGDEPADPFAGQHGVFAVAAARSTGPGTALIIAQPLFGREPAPVDQVAPKLSSFCSIVQFLKF